MQKGDTDRSESMGYYTQYTLEYVNGADENAVRDCINEVSGYHNPFDDTCKWYDHESDMKKVTLKFPGAEIMISGIGEEHPDMWRKWFKDGKMKMSKGRVVFDEPKGWE